MEDLSGLADEIAAGKRVAADVGMEDGSFNLDGEGASIVGFHHHSTAVLGGVATAEEGGMEAAKVEQPHVCQLYTLLLTGCS